MDSNVKPRKKNPSMEVHYDPSITRSVEDKQQPKQKSKTKVPTLMQKLTTKKSTDHYFTAGKKINDDNQRDLLKESSPFVYPKDLEEFSYKVMSKAWRDSLRRKELKLKYNERNNYQSRQQLDILNRLYVKEPSKTRMKTILDIDPDFFSIVEGRPIKEKFKISNNIGDMRKLIRLKIICGYRQDEIEQIEENFNEEQRLIDEVKSNYEKYVNAFEEFLFDDHTVSMSLLSESEKQAAIAAKKYEQYSELSKNFGKLRYTVYNLEEKWRSCKMYQKFLYLVSPVYWRRKYDYYHLLQKESHQSLVSEISTVFGRYRLQSSGNVPSLEDLVEQFMDDCNTQQDPLLFFNSPTQLLKVFRFIEIQNLNTLLHIEELAGPTENVKEGVKCATYVFDNEMQALQEIADSLEGGIIWEEQRAEYLEQLAKELINGDFKKLIAEEEVLNLYVFVEDVYEARVAPNDANIALADMMKAVEMKYRNYVLKLDSLPQEQVVKAETECFAEFERSMRIAQDAAKRVVQIERLTHRLKRALEPPLYKTTKELKWRSEPAKIIPPPLLPPRPLTSEESEYLTYFTEYCEKSDDLKEFGIDVNESKINRSESEYRKERKSEKHEKSIIS